MRVLRRRSFEPPRLLQTVRRIGIALTSVLLVFLLISVTLLALAPRRLETPAHISSTDELTAFLERLVATENPPGLSVAVVKDDELVYQRAFGFANGPEGIGTTPKSIYRWWSLTKILTAIAIFQLHERGQLDIEDEVRQYLPFFQTTFRGDEAPTIRLRHLLNHSSGLPNLRLEVLRWMHPEDAEGRGANELIAENFERFSRLRGSPGRRGRYSNFGYLLLGAVVEEVSGQSYEDYVVENILNPLGMNLTGFTIGEAMRPHIAAGCHPLVNFQTIFLPAIRDVDAYVQEFENGRIWLAPFYLDANAYGGAMGPVTDATRLLRALLNEGTLEGRSVLAPETARMMLQEGRVRAGSSSVAPPYYRRAGMEHGLGFWVFPSQDGERYEHTGAGLGFATLFRIYPEDRLAIALLANGTSLDREGIADRLFELFRD
jgi:CubicO group peptidase (beta-lactamase class C family)